MQDELTRMETDYHLAMLRDVIAVSTAIEQAASAIAPIPVQLLELVAGGDRLDVAGLVPVSQSSGAAMAQLVAAQLAVAAIVQRCDERVELLIASTEANESTTNGEVAP